MRILLVGHGGREHALLRTLRRDAPDAQFFITRGNGGTAGLATHVPIGAGDAPALAVWAESQNIDLVVVGPEAPLAEGIQEHFERRGIPLFGPSREAARIEASKAYAKDLMRRAGVPTAAFDVFDAFEPAEAFIREHGAPIVVKASGLAAGKGAVVCDSIEQALATARAMLGGRAFGEAGRRIVVEERLTGEELSVFALTDGTHALLMPATQDHKRLGEGDTGPNTGGMGAYTPVSIADAALMERVERTIFQPTLAALRADGRTFRGLLYAGLMLTDGGAQVIEFNARFGDPETQALLPLLRSPLLEPLLAIARGGSLAGHHLDWRDGAALTTVLASRGYPESSQKGIDITIPDDLEDDDCIVFHAGTRRVDGRLVTDGGRVLAVTGIGPSLAVAARRSREAADAIAFDGKQFRRDIGWRELARMAGTPPAVG
jgi:phosphoribosylamine--glycine ligase